MPYVPRTPFFQIARARNDTMTPPGFKDSGHGDFYLWADFLLGLLMAASNNERFTKAVLLTMDEKPDWSRGGLAHPILVAEVEALVGVPFEAWNLQRFASYVATAVTAPAEPETAATPKGISGRKRAPKTASAAKPKDTHQEATAAVARSPKSGQT